MGMRANAEISRKLDDPEFNVNKSKFYAVTPSEDQMYRKDAD